MNGNMDKSPNSQTRTANFRMFMEFLPRERKKVSFFERVFLEPVPASGKKALPKERCFLCCCLRKNLFFPFWINWQREECTCILPKEWWVPAFLTSSTSFKKKMTKPKAKRLPKFRVFLRLTQSSVASVAAFPLCEGDLLELDGLCDRSAGCLWPLGHSAECLANDLLGLRSSRHGSLKKQKGQRSPQNPGNCVKEKMLERSFRSHYERFTDVGV